MNPEIDVELLLRHIAKSDLLGREKLFLMELVQQSRWIPCSERLPEKDGRYLCVWLDNSVATFWFSNKHFRFSAEDTCEIDNLVTHWMPLPEPPEMEEEYETD